MFFSFALVRDVTMSDGSTSRWAMRTTYVAEGVAYECPGIEEAVTLDAYWYLDVDQGSEGFLSPCSTRVRCSRAGDCPVLKKKRCPLENVNQDVMNELRVRVLEGERWLRLEDDGSVAECGEAQAGGRVIWFGAVTVEA